jgi:MFS family permease
VPNNPKALINNTNLVSATTFLLSISSLSIIPVLPLFISKTANSYRGAGLVIASYYVAAILVQYPLATKQQTISKKFLISSGTLLFALGALGLALKGPLAVAIVSRAIQGAGFGATSLGANSLLALDRTLDFKGPAYAKLTASQISGSALGPLMAALIGFNHARLIFLSSLALSLIASALSIGLKNPVTTQDKLIYREQKLLTNTPLASVTIACLFFLASGCLTGMYDTTWSPYMLSVKSNSFGISLSWVAFSVPFVAFSPVAGKLTKTKNPVFLAFLSAMLSVFFAAIYPLVKIATVLIILCALEAIGASLGPPSIQTFLTTHTKEANQTKYQSFALISMLSGTAFFAAISGIFIKSSIVTPFYLAATVSLMCAILALAIFFSSLKKSRIKLQ